MLEPVDVTTITDNGLKVLSHMKNPVNKLYVQQTRVTPEAVNKLRDIWTKKGVRRDDLQRPTQGQITMHGGRAEEADRKEASTRQRTGGRTSRLRTFTTRSAIGSECVEPISERQERPPS